MFGLRESGQCECLIHEETTKIEYKSDPQKSSEHVWRITCRMQLIKTARPVAVWHTCVKPSLLRRLIEGGYTVSPSGHWHS